jgi:hypothetical protein
VEREVHLPRAKSSQYFAAKIAVQATTCTNFSEVKSEGDLHGARPANLEQRT